MHIRYHCDFCPRELSGGTEAADQILDHEPTCEYNPATRCCATCRRPEAPVEMRAVQRPRLPTQLPGLGGKGQVMSKPLPPLWQIDIERAAVKWDVPSPRATSVDEVLAIVRAVLETPHRRIVIDNVSWWNGPGQCSVTFTKDCPGKP